MSSPPELVGQKLGHYLIKEQIGAGGMGVVFLAHDERLERDVAIKILPASTFSDAAVRRRFRKEALILSKLNHPNIATIFDFDEENETCFLVTEYISGPTVDIIVTAGALPEAQIISLGAQLVDALIAAHDKGVVHCDLKPDNLRLTPDGRLKVLDFGIARLMHTATDENMATMTMTLTQTNEIRGTLPYMAPEQLLGDPPDARTDIWATGAVLYQLSSGTRPFQGKVATALAAEIIHTSPPPPSGLRKGLSPLLESTIMKCLEKKAEHRYQTARELKVDLDRVLTRQVTVPVLVPDISEEKSVEPPKKISWKLIAAILILCLGIAGGFYWRKQHPPVVAKSPTRQSIAVLGFANVTGNKQDDWISSILATQLPTELAAGGKIRMVSDEDVARAKQDLSLTNSGSLAGDTLARINRRLNSDLIVLGSFSNLDGNIRLDGYVQNTKSGETVTSFSESGSMREIERLITGTGIDLRQRLGLDVVDAATAELMRASMPSNTQAAQNYAEGVARLRMSDALGARDLLEKAVAADPKYAMAHSALSAAWDQLGYDSKKQEEAKKAFDLSGKLLREQKLLVEARYREAASDWDKAADIYRTLQAIAPDELDYGLDLANTQIRANKSREAISTIQSLHTLVSPERSDPRIALAAAEAALSLSDYKLAKESSEDSIQKAHQIGARSLVGRAEWRLCSALINLGSLDDAQMAGKRALQIYTDTTDLLGQARSLTCIANVFSSKGNAEEALKLHNQALDLANSIGAKRDSAGALLNVANLLSNKNDLTGAIERYKEALEICHQIDDKTQTILIENDLGALYFAQGLYNAAAQAYALAHQVAKEVGSLQGLIQARTNLSNIHLLQGKLNEAKDGIQEAIAASKQLNDENDNASALQVLGDIQLAQDDLDKAESSYSEFLKIEIKLGQNADIASARLSVAGLDLERAKFAEAEDFCHQAVQEFNAEKNADYETQSRALLSRILIAQGKVAEARAEIDQARKLGAANQILKLDLSNASARVLSKEKKYTVAAN